MTMNFLFHVLKLVSQALVQLFQDVVQLFQVVGWKSVAKIIKISNTRMKFRYFLAYLDNYD